MGLYLAQLPPAELARLKAELAETLIANFCYPRYMDYRTNTLRMRPVDRSKRQEVWAFLSSYDFAPWGRVDIQSPDFHRLVERLFIQYIQRNRAFFGNMGRKRMPDVRSLIGSSSVFVTEGLRSHLTSRQSGQPFGSPRLVVSWSGSTIDPSWEQVAGATHVLQQQIQEARGEIQAEGENGSHPLPTSFERPPASVPQKRSPRSRASSNGSGKIQAIVPPKSAMPPHSPLASIPPVAPSQLFAPNASAPQSVPPLPAQQPIVPANTTLSPKSTNPLDAPAPLNGMPIPPLAPPVPSRPIVEPTPPSIQAAPQTVEDAETRPFSNSQSLQEGAGKLSSPQSIVQPPVPQASAAMRELSRTPHSSLAMVPDARTTGALAKSAENETVMLSDEDVVIFEQMKYQLVVWLRVEAVRLGMDIANQTPLQLVELLRHQEDFDETRLQVVTTLLHLADAVTARGQAALIDYKQAMMFYLMHTRRAR